MHGVAGGEHIVHLDSGEYRYLTVRECMRVQGLPDELEIDTNRTAAIRQIGNAVPPVIGEVFGRAIARTVCGQALAGVSEAPDEKPSPPFRAAA
jgi:DNA (cytosine-5)-methyltransferase 1